MLNFLVALLFLATLFAFVIGNIFARDFLINELKPIKKREKQFIVKRIIRENLKQKTS
ncbi:hypothetical protein I5M32_11285 [Pedobacter sp. SD-b]|uniref:Uncharacterized protein n=1 Tax=Pedobacter segetis TaxID=2793069 RepID=A0ABS1BKW7_9SPHI|nr:hypothetical protein [Pedobacter segetis]